MSQSAVGGAFVAAVLIMGAKAEPFLPACLAGISKAVDLLVVNDNSGLALSGNLQAVQQSALHAQGKTHVIASEFRGFGYCRTLCLDYLRRLSRPDTWVLYLDCDEVHPPSIVALTRRVLPRLPAGIGVVDGYFHQFFQSSRYLVSLDHRHNMLFRFNQDITWDGVVHEKPSNLRGTRITVPHLYYHYGYMLSPDEIGGKWALYAKLGDRETETQLSGVEGIILQTAQRAVPFHGRHPEVALGALREVQAGNGAAVAAYEAAAAKANSGAGPRAGAWLQGRNLAMRVGWRAIQAAAKCGGPHWLLEFARLWAAGR